MSEPINPTDSCACGHSAASHGFDYADGCTLSNCACAGFALATKGEELPRDDRGLAGAREVGRVTMPGTLSGKGFWVAYGENGARGVYPDELGALRYAVTNHLQVKFCEWGELDV